MYAASGSNHETVRVLLEAGADPNIRDKVEQFTALMFAAAEGQLEVVQTLLDHRADVTLRDVDGDTALDFASQNGHSDVARLLSL
jgi:ankyrin repeat protein